MKNTTVAGKSISKMSLGTVQFGLHYGIANDVGKPPEEQSFEMIKAALEGFKATFDAADDANVWFDKVKAITEEMGFTTDMKAYKADPTAFPGTVADISTFLRQAITGKQNSPDLYTVTRILGYERTCERVKAIIASL